MKIDILDVPEKDFKLLIQKLRKAGLTDVYEKKDWLIVKRSDSIRVKVRHSGVKYEVRPLFPSIGNILQALSTFFLWGTLLFFDVPGSFIWGLLLGQVVSYGLHFPWIKKLQKQVEDLI